ncbi:MAG TPA: hypothetical protein VGM98_24840 [Schlesneria sp.]
MHFQMWFPGATGNARAVLEAAGLADFAEGCRESIAKFTDERQGLLISWTGDAGYSPDRQKWLPLKDPDGPQIGYWTDSPCTPADLQRRYLLTGFPIPLGTSGEWIVPRAKDLPAYLRLVNNLWESIRKPEFDEFWHRAAVWYRRFMTADLDLEQMAECEDLDPDVLLSEWCDFCVYALRQNYRILPQIASELDLLDTTTLIKITWAIVDSMDIPAESDLTPSISG